MSARVLTNARLVLDREIISGSMTFEDGVITGIDAGPTAVPGAMDCEGELVMPGLVELHTDNVERHMMPRPGSVWPTHSAIVNHDRELASVGITTVYDALTIGDFATSQIRIQLSQEFCPTLAHLSENGALKVDHHVHLRCEISSGHLMETLETLIDQPLVSLLSVMDHTPGQRQFRKIEKYEEYYKGKFNMTDAQFEAFCAERVADQKKHSAPNRQAVVGMARERGMPLASHDDATVAHVDQAIEDDMVIAEFPTTIEAARASHAAGMGVLMGGPNLVRGKSHSGNVAAYELAEAGLLDIISSDYVPSSLLYGAMTLVDGPLEISVPEVVAMVTKTPAHQAGLLDRGVLEVGKRADVIRVRRVPSPGGGLAPIVQDVWRRGEKIA